MMEEREERDGAIQFQMFRLDKVTAQQQLRRSSSPLKHLQNQSLTSDLNNRKVEKSVDPTKREALHPIDSNPFLDTSSKIEQGLKPLKIYSPLKKYSPKRVQTSSHLKVNNNSESNNTEQRRVFKPPLSNVDDNSKSNGNTETTLKTNAHLEHLHAKVPQDDTPDVISHATTSNNNTIPITDIIPQTSDVVEDVTLHSDDTDVPVEILEEMSKIQESFSLEQRYRLIDKIGEGTFSSVYKAEDLTGTASYIMGDGLWSSPVSEKRLVKRKKPNSLDKKSYVALKRIYVTSSPQRISNELRLLYMLTGSARVAPLLEALRHEDQIIAVLPYYPHSDFRDFFRDLPLEGIKIYMFELFQALNFVHNKSVIHRDIKPTNFLYDPYKKKGVLVDFGLAETEDLKIVDDPNHHNFCPCSSNQEYRIEESVKGYPKNDERLGRRANRAGTRGFRAPEVLFKCPYQTTKIDIWSAGVILLTLLSRRFPFFNSRDDTDALIELTTIFGLKEMQECASYHGLGIETSLSTLGRKLSLEEIIYKSLSLEKQKSTLPSDSVGIDTLNVFNNVYEILIDELEDSRELIELKQSHLEAFEVMEHCFELDPKKRSSALKILNSPFFKSLNSNEDDEIDLIH